MSEGINRSLARKEILTSPIYNELVISSDGKTTAIQISIEEWNKFLESIERLDVLNWKESYIDPSISDGTQWLFQIRTESFEIYTGGSNAYPENFNGLIESINKLIKFDNLFTLDTKSGSMARRINFGP